MIQAKTLKNGTKYRVVWGNVCRGHGTNGVVRAKFRTNLPVSLSREKRSVFVIYSRIFKVFPSVFLLVISIASFTFP